MRVYEMSARYSRKVQVKQFEPAEAEFEMKVELDETDDPKEVREYLMFEVRDAVTQAFQGRAGKGAEVKVTQKTEAPATTGDEDSAEDAEAEKPKRRGRPPGSKSKSKSEESEEAEPLDLDPPKDNVVDLKPNGEDKVEAEEDESELTLVQVKNLMNKVTGDGMKIPKVRELLDQFGVGSTTELDPARYREFFQGLSEIQSEELEL